MTSEALAAEIIRSQKLYHEAMKGTQQFYIDPTAAIKHWQEKIDNCERTKVKNLAQPDVSCNEANPKNLQSGEVTLPFFCLSNIQKMGRCQYICAACELLNKNGNDR